MAERACQGLATLMYTLRVRTYHPPLCCRYTISNAWLE